MPDRQTILELAELGMTSIAIAKKLGITRQAVQKVLKRYCMTVPRQMRQDGKLAGKVEKVLAWAAKHGVRSAAKRYKVSRQAVYYHMPAKVTP